MSATPGDVFRSYQPSGDGRDVHLFISSAATTVPHTSKHFDNFRSPVPAKQFVEARTV
jgi:hypothetical protein